MKFDRALVWFRRDLRASDHAALAAAMTQARQVWCLFVFDRDILDALPSRTDRRVEFIHAALQQLHATLVAAGGGLIVATGRACDLVPQVAGQLQVDAVFANRDYEPAANRRDRLVADRLRAQRREWRDFKDQVIFETSEVLTAAGTPFSVFTPYKNAWLRRLLPHDLLAHRVSLPGPLAPVPAAIAPATAAPAGTTVVAGVPALASIGFEPTNLVALKIPLGMTGAASLIERFEPKMADYREARDYPAQRGTSGLSVHLRFGTVSIRRLASLARSVQAAQPQAADGAGTWLSELIWRDFYFQILHHHPQVVDHAFKPAFDQLRWRDSPADLAAWCEGRTGYPLVDAAMLQLLQTGYMHNRLRMISASFLVKDLGLDWRLGEAFFARHLNDYDLAANNGGWQWAASTGCDAQPWFRIFNPVTQSQRFDPQGRFIRRYLPQLAGLADKKIHAPWLASAGELAQAGVRLGEQYPPPIVDHDQARKETLRRFGVLKEPAQAGRPG